MSPEGHHHDHGDCHDTAVTFQQDDAMRRKMVLRKLYTASALCAAFIVVEVIGGLWAHSLAILSDAAHLMADLASFVVAIAASYLASLPATRQHTFGLKRTESLAALFSMVSLAFVSIGLGYEAIHRLWSPPEKLVNGKFMSGIAVIGVLVNIALAVVLGEDHVHMPGSTHGHAHGDHDEGHDHSHGHGHSHSSKKSNNHKDNKGAYQPVPTSYQNGGGNPHDLAEGGHSHAHGDHGDHEAHEEHSHEHHDHHHQHHNDEEEDERMLDRRNVNLRAAYLHVMADLAQSVAVVVGGLVIWLKPEWHAIDPILTLLFAAMVLYSTLGVLRTSIAVLLEEIPPSISWQKVYSAISNVPNVNDVHDLHIWCISHGQISLSVHCSSTDPKALENINQVCHSFNIVHTTIQIQSTGGRCVTCEGDCCTGHLA